MSVNNTQVTFNGGLFDIIEHSMLHTKLKLPSVQSASEGVANPSVQPASEDVAKPSGRIERLVKKFTPDLMIIHVENTEVKSLNKHNSYHYHLFLQRIDIKANFGSSHATRAKISNLRIYTPAHEALHLKEVSIDSKSSDNVIASRVKLDTVNIVYNHDDIYGWFKKILLAGMKSNRKELILKAFRMANEKMIELYHSEFTQRLFSRITLNNTTELQNLIFEFQVGDQVSSINASKLKFILNQSTKLRRHSYEDYALNLIFQRRHWAVELISDGPLCWFMDQKFNYLQNEFKKTYIRGSAAFVGSAYVRVGSNYEGCRLDVRVNTFRAEYSHKLTSFAVESMKSFKEYVDLFSHLKSGADKIHSQREILVSIRDALNQIEMDVIISNVSLFFINRHDVCIFINLKDVFSNDSFNYSLDTLEVSAVDFTTYESVCDLSEFSSIYTSTKMMKISLLASTDHPQICVDFAEKLECSWNAHFLRHLLSLARDFHRFKQHVEAALGIESEQRSLMPRSFPVSLDIKKLRNIKIRHSDVNVDKLFLLISELATGNLFFYNYFH